MTLETKVRWLVVVGVLLLVLFVVFSEEVEERVAPKLKRALIAIEVEDGVARTGRTEIHPGDSFKLHAVVEAEERSGRKIFYTEAAALEIEGETISSDRLRRWDRPLEPRVLWFTVEGFKPFVDVGETGGMEEFHFREFLRPSWPRTWSIPGSLQGSGDASLRQQALGDAARFGTQRYHVRIELFGAKSQITPQVRLQSTTADSLPEAAEELATVTAASEGRLAVPTSYFGIPQIELGSKPEPATVRRLEDWMGAGLAFTRGNLLKRMLVEIGVAYEDLQWSDIDLAEQIEWAQGAVEAGDLLRVGERWVVLFEDRGQAGSLDRDDLCLDFDKGPRVNRIGDVFTGDGLIEWASTSK